MEDTNHDWAKLCGGSGKPATRRQKNRLRAHARLMMFMHKKTAITALVALLSCAAFSESRPSRFDWKARPTEKFALSNRAKRKLPLAIPPIGASDTAMVNLALTSQFPVTISVQDARGDSVGSCHYSAVTEIAANCALRWDNKPRYIVIEDVNEAGLTEGMKGTDALNRVTLIVSDYTCKKNCPKLQ
jgi:hypothetical protein